MSTACVLIGNSDNKLSQIEWSYFISAVYETLVRFCKQMHFRGYSPSDSSYQNACWVFTIDPNEIQDMREALSPIGKEFNQDSIAIVIVNTEFV